MNKRLLFLLISLLSFQGFAQEEKYQALFMYKFIQNLEFPEGKIGDNYQVGISGSGELRSQLAQLTEGRRINGKSITISEYAAGSDISGLCILFLSHDNSELLTSLKEQAVSSSVILVGEKPGLTKKGAALNFSRASGRLGFEMNLKSLESSNVKSSNSLRLMAIQVE